RLEEHHGLIERLARAQLLLRTTKHPALGEQRPRELERDRAASVLAARTLERVRCVVELAASRMEQPAAARAHRCRPRDPRALRRALERLEHRLGAGEIAHGDRGLD